MSKPGIIGPPKMSHHITAGIYGDTGVGKSRLTATSPGHVLIIKAPAAKIDSWLPEDKARARRGEIEVAEVRDHDDLSGDNGLLPFLREEGEQYDWVWMDDVQSLFDVGMDDLWETVIQEKPARARYGLDQSEFGINMDRLARWLRYVLGPDKFNFGFTSWADKTLSPDKDSDGDPIEKLMPYVQGKGMSLKFSGYMNVLAYMSVVEVKGRDKPARLLRTESSPTYYAMDKFDAFNGRVLDPTVPKIENLVKKSQGYTAPAKTTNRPAATAGRRPVRVKTARKS